MAGDRKGSDVSYPCIPIIAYIFPFRGEDSKTKGSARISTYVPYMYAFETDTFSRSRSREFDHFIGNFIIVQ